MVSVTVLTSATVVAISSSSSLERHRVQPEVADLLQHRRLVRLPGGDDHLADRQRLDPALPQPLGKSFIDKTTPLLLDLGREFIELQYYLASPAIDHFAWARVIDGKLVRAFAIGDEGVVWNKGKPGKEEKAMGLKLFELRGVRGRRGDAGNEIILYPTEEHVMRLASKWSIDPTRISDVRTDAALGWIGLAPARWRSERARKVA